MLNISKLVHKSDLSSENESHDYSTNKDKKEEPKAIEAAEELQKE